MKGNALLTYQTQTIRQQKRVFRAQIARRPAGMKRFCMSHIFCPIFIQVGVRKVHTAHAPIGAAYFESTTGKPARSSFLTYLIETYFESRTDNPR